MRGFSIRRLGLNTAFVAVGLFGINRTAVAANYYVNQSLPGTVGPGTINGISYTAGYNTINAALAAVPAGSSPTTPNVIYFAPGTYNTALTTGVSLSDSRSNLSFVGMTGNPDDVVITSYLDAAWNPGSGAIGTSGSASLQIKGNNVSAENITFANSTDIPYVYAVSGKTPNPESNGSYTGTTQSASTKNGQAVALLLQGDEDAFTNVKVLGYQDTLYTKGGRSYFNNSYITGDTDFIFANGTTVINNSTVNQNFNSVTTLNVQTQGTVTAASTDKRTSNGLVFLNDTLTTNSVNGNAVLDPTNNAATALSVSTEYLGRPWGWDQPGGDASTVLLNTKMASTFAGPGWEIWDSTETANPTWNNENPAEDSRYAEYNSMDLSGNPLDVSGRVSWSHQFSAAQAAAYSVGNIFASPDPWYGLGYAGSADPTSPTYSWAAYWGTRNATNEDPPETNPGNPASYSDPSWTLAGSWDANAQLALLPQVPEPATGALLAGLILLPLGRRPKRS